MAASRELDARMVDASLLPPAPGAFLFSALPLDTLPMPSLGKDLRPGQRSFTSRLGPAFGFDDDQHHYLASAASARPHSPALSSAAAPPGTAATAAEGILSAPLRQSRALLGKPERVLPCAQSLYADPHPLASSVSGFFSRHFGGIA